MHVCSYTQLAISHNTSEEQAEKQTIQLVLDKQGYDSISSTKNTQSHWYIYAHEVWIGYLCYVVFMSLMKLFNWT